MQEIYTAEKCNSDGNPGYMVSQWQGEKQIVKQFVPEQDYKEFCETIGCVTEQADEKD
ncbi:MAG: hypothetical protein ACI4FX_05230 [Agathobacter sp.]